MKLKICLNCKCVKKEEVKKATEKIITKLRERGYRIEKVNELLKELFDLLV